LIVEAYYLNGGLLTVEHAFTVRWVVFA